MEVTRVFAEEVGVVTACGALAVARAGYYRHWKPKGLKIVGQGRRTPARALSVQERQQVLDLMHSERFMDAAPRGVYATMLDEGSYLCSVSTMYRLLAQEGEIRERRDQLRHPSYHKPRAAGHGAQRGVVLGHHQAARDRPSGSTSISM